MVNFYFFYFILLTIVILWKRLFFSLSLTFFHDIIFWKVWISLCFCSKEKTFHLLSFLLIVKKLVYSFVVMLFFISFSPKSDSFFSSLKNIMFGMSTSNHLVLTHSSTYIKHHFECYFHSSSWSSSERNIIMPNVIINL